jgi:hypothetical protein
MNDITRNVNCTLFGTMAQQKWVDLLLWEMFFNRAGVIKRFVELGTGYGAMSLYFYAQCIARGIEFDSYDIDSNRLHSSPLAEMVGLHNRCHIADIFSHFREIGNKIKDGPTILYCDNGNKRKEWKIYSAFLRNGDFFSVHDWGTEFLEEDLANSSLENGLYLRPVEQLFTEEQNSMTRWYRICRSKKVEQ